MGTVECYICSHMAIWEYCSHMTLSERPILYNYAPWWQPKLTWNIAIKEITKHMNYFQLKRGKLWNSLFAASIGGRQTTQTNAHMTYYFLLKQSWGLMIEYCRSVKQIAPQSALQCGGFFSVSLSLILDQPPNPHWTFSLVTSSNVGSYSKGVSPSDEQT